MTLKITYKSGKSEIIIGVNLIEKNGDDIIVESFQRVCRLEKPRPTENKGVESMELFFNTIN
ncbi:MAG: hypothetical protein AABY22_09220 [Nanoarchaeota archaeon]